MKVIRDILSLSPYKPTSGNQLQLYNLLADNSLDKESIEKRFKKSPAQFRNTYKELKDNLLDGLIQRPVSDLSKIKQKHISIRKKQLEAFILLQSGQRQAGLAIAEEGIRMAEKYGVISVALEMSRSLSTYYSLSKSSKYLKYKEKVEKLLRLQAEEASAQKILDELNYLISKNRSWDHLLPEIESLKLLLPNNKEYRFRLCYYYILSYVYSLQGNSLALINNCEEAIEFFNKIEVRLPHTVKWGFLLDSIPLFVLRKQYAKAEQILSSAILLPPKGSFNWHITQQYIAFLGFYSGKPAMAKTALEISSANSRKVAPIIEARWKIIHAYLALYEKEGKVTGISSFRLYRLLNEVSELHKSETKRNFFILELLHLLASEKHFEYLNRTDGVEQYLSRNAKGKEDNRLRYFLRMLKCISTGRFHTIRVEAHAKKNKAKLVNSPVTNDLNILEKEIVPYELLWELALSFLKK